MVEKNSSKEEANKLWLIRGEKCYRNGRQVVDNFYLDFLKANPEFIDDSEIGGVCWCSPEKWERTSSKLPEAVVNLFFPRIFSFEAASEERKKAMQNLLASVFKSGSLSFGTLEPELNNIPEEDWMIWIKQNNLSRYTPTHNRISIFKIFLSSSLSMLGNMTITLPEELMRFHNLK